MLTPIWTGVATGTLALLVALAPLAACSSDALVLTRLLDARRLAAEMHVEFVKASEASNRAVMADTDDAASAAVGEARRAHAIVEANMNRLGPLIDGLGYAADRQALDAFRARYQAYREVEDEILPLAVENTNVKAQRLSFGPARDAADQIIAALNNGLTTVPPTDWRSRALVAQATSAVRAIQALHAPHIAEADLEAMTRMEEQMAKSEADARHAITTLRQTLPGAATPSLDDALIGLDRFNAVHAELIALSRRNSDVQSLAWSLGR
jgi:hypothetical protein